MRCTSPGDPTDTFPPDLIYLGGYVLLTAALVDFLQAYRNRFPVSSERGLKLTLIGVGTALIGLGAS